MFNVRFFPQAAHANDRVIVRVIITELDEALGEMKKHVG